ncbi:hypothetical protein NDU88_004538 [Pleurodeles waltl]|uniref:Uncharacterized protein n=1 Tax=Pleurodeles waltl TaxID=8319 RepID=A0AAV7NSS5_PLEWA|nr:hypothetical protein NDU88_004538 [Pleurodeles waltl]
MKGALAIAEALRILKEAGRKDPLVPVALDQLGMADLACPPQRSSDGLAAAVLGCLPPHVNLQRQDTVINVLLPRLIKSQSFNWKCHDLDPILDSFQDEMAQPKTAMCVGKDALMKLHLS